MANVLNRTISRLLLKRQIWCRKVYSVCYSSSTLWSKHLTERKFNYEYTVASINYPGRCNNLNYSTDKKQENESTKLTLFQKFKQMYRDYWYVLVPVHLVSSTMWFGGFYYMAKSGIDIVYILESWQVSEKVTNPLRDSSMGYYAIAYACYKIATPARYTVTLGGTTISINYLRKWGYIKPVPSTERIKEIYKEKTKSVREGIKEKKETFMESIHETTEGIKEKKDNLIQTVKKTAEKKKPPINIKEKTKI